MATDQTPSEPTAQQSPEATAPFPPLAPAANSVGPTKQSLVRKLGTKIGTFVLVVYFWGVIPSFFYFSWQYARESGFWSWLFLGEIVPAGKSLAWPYLLFAGSGKTWTKEEKANLAHFVRLGNILKKADGLIQRRKPDEDARKIEDLWTEALIEGKTVKDAVLAKVHPDLPTAFRQKLVPSIELRIEAMSMALSDGDPVKVQELSVRAEVLNNEWEDWLKTNGSPLRIPTDVPE